MPLKLQQTARCAILILLGAMPLLFGAVHPIAVGLSTAFMLMIFGSWLLLNSSRISWRKLSAWGTLLPLLFIGWIAFCSLPLPMAAIEVLSPHRAASLRTVNQLAGTDISWTALNYNSAAGLTAAIFFFALLLYAVVLKLLLEHDHSLFHAIAAVGIGIGLLEAVYGMLQVANPHIGVLWLISSKQFAGMARGTIIYKNQYASLLNMCWPFAVMAALRRFKMVQEVPAGGSRKKRKRSRSWIEKVDKEVLQGAIFLFLASFMMMAVLFSQSRGGAISMLLILVLMLISIPMQQKNKLLLAGFLLLFTVGYGSVVGFSNVIGRFFLIEESGAQRFNIWLASLPMLRDHLFAGAGYGSYVILSSVYLKKFPEYLLFDRAHNDYLELAIELGLPAALLFFLVLFAALFLYAKRLCRYSTKDKLADIRSSKLTGLISACAFAGFLFHGAVDFGWRLPANVLYAVTLFVLTGHSARSHSAHHHAHRHQTALSADAAAENSSGLALTG